MGERLKQKVAVVTGAGRGIGRGEALALAAEGAKVVVNDVGCAVDGTGASTAPADEVVAEITKMGGSAIANYENVASFQGAERILKSAIDNFGRLDILVNNAAILRDRMIFDMTKEEWDAVIGVNLKGTFNCTKHASVLFRQQRSGRIINTSATEGIATVGQANYAASKEGIVGFTRIVARDMGRYGVTCNCLRPTAQTRMYQEQTIEARAVPLDVAPMPWTTEARLAGMDPDVVGPFVIWLCTDDAADVNGYVFGVCGGSISLYFEPRPRGEIYKMGVWTTDELVSLIPQTLSKGLVNPAPPR